MDDGATDQRYAEEALSGFLDALGDRGGNFLGLAVADTDHAVAVADDDQRGEAEAPTTLDHLGDAVDGDDALEEVALLSAVAAATATTSSRRPRPSRSPPPPPPRGGRLPVVPAAPVPAAGCSAIMQSFRFESSSEFESALPRGVGQRSDAAAVGVSAAIEHHGVESGGLGTLGDQLSDPDAVGLLVTLDGADVGLDGRCRRQRGAALVVHQLDVDVTRGAVDHQARTLGGTGDLLAQPRVATQPRSPASLGDVLPQRLPFDGRDVRVRVGSA